MSEMPTVMSEMPTVVQGFGCVRIWPYMAMQGHAWPHRVMLVHAGPHMSAPGLDNVQFRVFLDSQFIALADSYSVYSCNGLHMTFGVISSGSPIPKSGLSRLLISS